MEKKIYLYADKIGFVEYIDHMGSDLKSVNAARNSYGKYSGELSKEDVELLGFLMNEKHYGVLEHNSVTFRFMVPMFIRSQHHRHRTWSYNEISRRYTSYNLQFYYPEHLRQQSKVNKQGSEQSDSIEQAPCIEKIKAISEACLSEYNNLRKAGVCREQARMVLPQNLYTSYWGTANLRNLLHFLDLREDSHAQWEIVKMAEAVRTILEELFPNIMKHHKESKNGCRKMDQG